ncbi:Stp1/IreP family PP2C-type Ser/Thr phosphatase [bacterium]
MNNSLDCYAVSDKGMRRRLNEDSHVCNPDLGLFLVADGMGGESCGDVASRLTAETFVSSITPYIIDDEATAPFEHTNGDFFLNAMEHSAEHTNQAVIRSVKESPACRGMGSTLTAAMINEGVIYIVHVGDSRLYKFENESLSVVTEDHTRVQELVNKKVLSAEEARTHRERHIITRCVGRKKQFKPDLLKLELQPETLYMLCSDGLYDMINDDAITEIIQENQELEQVGKQLVDRANKNGGKDNITIVLFRQSSENNSGESG